ncbi:hypothetical protein DSCO28_36740 [Desulfosarcina ovata subsp. sediminis]|uniref:Uncharacterized protein n=1 Tax=Desulfosarcina ovata subsp. sediminis TaxID=885957 RepID=A0A5K7ZSC5_9BACT|nr:hypothetical protein [Desulfosarcina ovata]BBO83108.1 hypothetical protein DSCO28_36740 [Desulfosarcina ovata subsp. sediminis]
MLERKLIERVAGAFLSDERLVEKDWHVVQAIRVISFLDGAGAIPVFSGGTSLTNRSGPEALYPYRNVFHWASAATNKPAYSVLDHTV